MKMMKQKYSVIVLFLLILASGATSFQSYQSTRSLVTRDMERALALTLKEQQSNVISADTIQLFNNNLLLEQLPLLCQVLGSHHFFTFRPASSLNFVGGSHALGLLLLL